VMQFSPLDSLLSAIVSEDHNKLREAVAVENGFALYRQYSEKEAARFAHVDPSTLKRWRRKALVSYIRFGANGVRYLGIHVADLIIRGTGPWDDIRNVVSSSGSSGLGSGQAAPPGIAAGVEATGPSVLVSARRTLTKPSNA
jgi:hypothetical protein